MTDTTTLAEAIVALSRALDPNEQGEQWPDPVAWDGRPLPEQARDLLALAGTGVDDDTLYPTGCVRDAERELRIALEAHRGA